MSVTVIASDATVEVNTSQRVISPSGWDEQIAEYGRGANLVAPTGQTTVFRTGDDASIEASVFAPIRVANSLKVKNSLVDFLTLGNTNFFGNTKRFTDINGLQVYGDDYVIDHYRHMGIKRTLETTAIWDDAIDNALAKSFAGFNDYFVMNLSHLYLLNNFGVTSVNLMNYTPFNLIFPDMWASTTRTDLTTQAMEMRAIGRTSIAVKTSSQPYLIARLHTF